MNDNEPLVPNCRSMGMRDKKTLDPKIIENYIKFRENLRKNKD